MNIKERVRSLKNAYSQLTKALERKIDFGKDVDPEKMKITLSYYKLAAEDSKGIWNEILELEEKVIVSKEDYEEIEKLKKERTKLKSGGLSPEDRRA